MIVCVLTPSLALRAALGEEQQRLREPIALGPQHDEAPVLGQVSPTAHELGVRPGMRLSEALDICPRLGLVTPDPGRAAEIHELVLRRLEGIGAGVDSGREGEIFFESDGLERLHGGPEGVLAAVSGRLGPSVLSAAAPTRLAAFALARQSAGDAAPATRAAVLTEAR